MTIELRPSGYTPELSESYSRLFSRCFPQAKPFEDRYLSWLYADNPDGSVLGYDAWSEGRLAAHYVCIPARAIVHGVSRPVLLSLNTATDPDFQGQGLFTKLADATYQLGASRGFASVYGIANANSTPGFVRKLGFTLVSPLDARVGLGAIGEAPQSSPALSFRREWTPETLAWRIANPVRPYRLCRPGSQLVGAYAPTGRPGINAWAEVAAADAAGLPTGSSPLGMRLHLGLRPRSSRRAGLWMDVPQRFRPSPLNLIFRSLGTEAAPLDPENIYLGQLDFDAF
jgi:GNAT superfamily N-acetyltransferase